MMQLFHTAKKTAVHQLKLIKTKISSIYKLNTKTSIKYGFLDFLLIQWYIEKNQVKIRERVDKIFAHKN